jgi:hypothetical protein
MILAVPALQPYLNALSCHDGADFVNLRGIGQVGTLFMPPSFSQLIAVPVFGFWVRVKDEAAAALGELVERVQLSRESLHLSLKLPLALTEPSDASPVSLLLSRLVPVQMKRRGVEMRIVLEGDATPNRVDLLLLKAVARARRWTDDLLSGKVRSVADLARREGIDGRSVRRLIPLGFLAPRIIEAIAEGRQPAELTVEALTRRIDLPLLWGAQEQDVDSSLDVRSIESRRLSPALRRAATR